MKMQNNFQFDSKPVLQLVRIALAEVPQVLMFFLNKTFIIFEASYL